MIFWWSVLLFVWLLSGKFLKNMLHILWKLLSWEVEILSKSHYLLFDHVLLSLKLGFKNALCFSYMVCYVVEFDICVSIGYSWCSIISTFKNDLWFVSICFGNIVLNEHPLGKGYTYWLWSRPMLERATSLWWVKATKRCISFC